jgi:transposase-like protein
VIYGPPPVDQPASPMSQLMPTIFELHNWFFDEGACLDLLHRIGAFYVEKQCETCGSTMNLSLTRQKFRCSRSTCRKQCSLRVGTFFEGSRLPCSKIMLMGYLWCNKSPSSAITAMTGHSNQTVAVFQNHFRQLVSGRVQTEDMMIGGCGIIVEIDESKLGMLKFKRGHRVEGVWVLGGVERTPERRVFMVPVERRDAGTLLDAINRHVRPGSIIYTDMWKAYAGLAGSMHFEHHAVNHSLHFSDPLTGVDTNKIEATWNALKQLIRPRNRTRAGIEEHLFEFIWRRQNHSRVWHAFLDAIVDTHYSVE